MTTTRFSKKPEPSHLPGGLEGIDRLFGRDLRSQGWAVDLTQLTGSSGSNSYHNRIDATPDPAMIWVIRGRRR